MAFLQRSFCFSLFRPVGRTGLAGWRCGYSTTTTTGPAESDLVDLVFDRHLPPGQTDTGNAKKPIVFLHGLFGSRKNNRTISKVLARDLNRTVYALDLRNHGESPHCRPHDYVHMAADVQRFIRQHGLESPILIGHSMGAKTAMTVALDSPESISALVSVDNAPVAAVLSSDFSTYVKAMKQVDQAGLKRISDADAAMVSASGGPDRIPEPVRMFLLTNLARQGPEKAIKFRIPLDTLSGALDEVADFPFGVPDDSIVRSGCSGSKVVDRPVRFVKPALFVRGVKSGYVPDETIAIIGRFFPAFRMADVDAGHWLISEKPEEFRRVVVEFISQLEDETESGDLIR